MEIYLTNVMAARAGADFRGVRSLWAGPVVTSPVVTRGSGGKAANHAQHLPPASNTSAVGTREARFIGLGSVPAMTRQIVVTVDEPLTVNGNRKQTVHTTRMSAGGYGAMGPHPDREPA